MEYDTHAVEEAVLSVLGGATPAEAAALRGLSPERLARAIELYRTAGRAALDTQPEPSGWLQVNIEFADYPTADHAFRAHLLPHLRAATAAGLLARWWFVRKFPYWRLRATPGSGADFEDMAKGVTAALDTALARGAARRWSTAPYESETYAFGGTEGMRIAHELFHTDSLGILDYREHASTGPAGLLGNAKSTSLLALTMFLRAAGQEWSEQGDVWARVAAKRPKPEQTAAARMANLTGDLRRLLMIDPTELLKETGALAPISPWIDGLESAGHALAQATSEGHLSAGTRGILARHVLFHWNRMGLPTTTQGVLAHAARDAVLGN